MADPQILCMKGRVPKACASCASITRKSLLDAAFNGLHVSRQANSGTQRTRGWGKQAGESIYSNI